MGAGKNGGRVSRVTASRHTPTHLSHVHSSIGTDLRRSASKNYPPGSWFERYVAKPSIATRELEVRRSSFSSTMRFEAGLQVAVLFKHSVVSLEDCDDPLASVAIIGPNECQVCLADAGQSRDILSHEASFLSPGRSPGIRWLTSYYLAERYVASLFTHPLILAPGRSDPCDPRTDCCIFRCSIWLVTCYSIAGLAGLGVAERDRDSMR